MTEKMTEITVGGDKVVEKHGIVMRQVCVIGRPTTAQIESSRGAWSFRQWRHPQLPQLRTELDMFKSQTAASLKSDQRAATRKPLRSHGIVALEGAGSLDIDTIDISAGGVCISSAQQLAAGQRCVIKFDMLVNGRKCSIAAVAKISYCVYGGNVGFKSGLQFIEIDPACVKVIVAFVNS